MFHIFHDVVFLTSSLYAMHVLYIHILCDRTAGKDLLVLVNFSHKNPISHLEVLLCRAKLLIEKRNSLPCSLIVVKCNACMVFKICSCLCRNKCWCCYQTHAFWLTTAQRCSMCRQDDNGRRCYQNIPRNLFFRLAVFGLCLGVDVWSIIFESKGYKIC